MKLYELSYVISQNSTEEELRSLQEKVTNFIVQEEGTLNRIEDISKKRPGFLATVNFYLKEEKIAPLNAKLKSEGKINNFLILNKKPQRITEAPRRIKPLFETSEAVSKSKKVEIKEIEKKLEEILGE